MQEKRGTKIKPIKSTLSKALDYIENPDKTDGKMLISSFGCSYETADIEFGYTLSQALDKGNNLAFHLIQSFAPGEVDYEKAHEIGKQLADAVTKGQHEYVVTTHIDKGHIHNHIIFCAVNFVDHHKYNSNKRSYYGIRNMSDKLCRENGLSVVVPGKGSKGKSYAEYQAEKTGTSWKGKLKTVSYTHLDVYKRQPLSCAAFFVKVQNGFAAASAAERKRGREKASRRRCGLFLCLKGEDSHHQFCLQPFPNVVVYAKIDVPALVVQLPHGEAGYVAAEMQMCIRDSVLQRVGVGGDAGSRRDR